MIKTEYCCRWAPSLGSLEATHQEVWGTKEYDPATDIDKPTVFFGLYGLKDFFALWNHKGPKYILWAGSDIRHFINGYWLDDEGKIRIEPHQIAHWIADNCESYVENEIEQVVLERFGITSTIAPSFLGKVEDFEVSYKHSDRPRLYSSVSGDNFELYGWDQIPALAIANPNIEFHLYGNETDFVGVTQLANIFAHGRVPKEQMNEEIKTMQGALRLAPFDGFSEILAKSVLMGQWPVSIIPYPHMLALDRIGELVDKHEPNINGRVHYKHELNNYPWNKNKHE